MKQQTHNPITALIFDFDGTLVDTMPLHFEAYRRVLSEVQIELTPDDFYSNIGGNARETIPKLLRGRDCSLSTGEIHARKKELINRLLVELPIPVLETAKLLGAFHGRLPMALASSGSRPGIEIVLKRFEWEPFFRRRGDRRRRAQWQAGSRPVSARRRKTGRATRGLYRV